MSTQSELFDRAADCDRLMHSAVDQDKKLVFRLLRDMWLALANESLSMSEPDLSAEIATIDQLQSELEPATTMH